MPAYREKFPPPLTPGSEDSPEEALSRARFSRFQAWMGAEKEGSLKEIFYLPKQEIHQRLKSDFKFKSAFQVVMCAVIEQVEKYDVTGYTNDGATEPEIVFEVRLD